MEYYISVNNEKRGPYSIGELRKRGLTSETLVMADGSEKWVPAWQIEELNTIIEGQPAQPDADESDYEDAGTAKTTNKSYLLGRPLSSEPSHDEPERRHGCLKAIFIAFMVFCALVIVAIATCPDEAAHRSALTNEVGAAIVNRYGNKDSTWDSYSEIDDLFRDVSDTWITEVAATAFDNIIHVENHTVYSTGKVSVGGKEHIVSVGLFGHVFTVDKDDIKSAAESYYDKSEKDLRDILLKKLEDTSDDDDVLVNYTAKAIKKIAKDAIGDIMKDLGLSDDESNDDSGNKSDSTDGSGGN